MFCTKCGAQMAEGQRFCSNCGAPAEQLPPPEPKQEPVFVREEAPAEEQSFRPEPPSYIPPEEPGVPKKEKKDRPKGKAKGWILGVLAVLVLAAAALVVFRWNAVAAFSSNLVAKTFSEPEDYYQRVEKNHVNKYLDAAEEGEGIFAVYQEAAETRALGKASFMEEKLQFSFEESAVGDEILDLIEDELGVDVSWFKNLGFYLSVGAEDELYGGSLTAFLNDKDIIDADFALDAETEMVYARVPSLSDQYLAYDLHEARAAMTGVSASEELIELLQDPDLIPTLVDRYSEIVIGDLTKVDKGTQELSAGGLSGRFTALEVKIDGKVMLKIAKDVLKKAQNDAELEKLICAYLKSQGMNEEQVGQYYDQLLDKMEDLRTEFEERDPESITRTILMTVYVDGQGRVRGRDVKIREGKEVRYEISYVLVFKGLNYGFRAEYYSDKGWDDYRNEMTATLDGDGKVSLSGEITGSFDLRLKNNYGYKDNETKENLKLLKLGLEAAVMKDGLRFELSMTPQKDLYDIMVEELDDELGDLPESVEELARSLSAVYSGEIKSGSGSVALTLKNGKKALAALSVDSYRVEDFDIVVPRDAVDPYEWIAGLDYSKLSDIMEALTEAGLPASAFDGVGSFF